MSNEIKETKYAYDAFINGNETAYALLMKSFALLAVDQKIEEEDTFFKVIEHVFKEKTKLKTEGSVKQSNMLLTFLKTAAFKNYLPEIKTKVHSYYLFSFLSSLIFQKKEAMAKAFLKVLYDQEKPDINMFLDNRTLPPEDITFIIKNFKGWNKIQVLEYLLDSNRFHLKNLKLFKEQKIILESFEYDDFINSVINTLTNKNSVNFIENMVYINHLTPKILNAFASVIRKKEVLLSELSNEPGSFLYYVSKKENLFNLYQKEPLNVITTFIKFPELLEQKIINVDELLEVIFNNYAITNDDVLKFTTKRMPEYIELIEKLYSNNKIETKNLGQHKSILTFIANFLNPNKNTLNKGNINLYDLFKKVPIDFHHQFKYEGKETTLNNLLVEYKNLSYAFYSLNQSQDNFTKEQLKEMFSFKNSSQYLKENYFDFFKNNFLAEKIYSILTDGLTDKEIFKELYILVDTSENSKLSDLIYSTCFKIFENKEHDFKLDLQKEHPYIDFINLNKKSRYFRSRFLSLIYFLGNDLVNLPIVENEGDSTIIHNNLLELLNYHKSELLYFNEKDIQDFSEDFSFHLNQTKNKTDNKIDIIKNKGIFGRLFSRKAPPQLSYEPKVEKTISIPIFLYKSSSKAKSIIYYDNQGKDDTLKISSEINQDFKDLLESAYFNIGKLNTIFEKNDDPNIKLDIKIRAEILLLNHLNFLEQIKENQNNINFSDILFLKSNTSKYLFKSIETYIESLAQIKNNTISEDDKKNFINNIQKEVEKQISLLEKDLELVHQHIKSQINTEVLDKMIVQTKTLEARQEYNYYNQHKKTEDSDESELMFSENSSEIKKKVQPIRVF